MTRYADDLDAYLADVEIPDDLDDPPPYDVEHDEHANRLLRARDRINAEIGEIEDAAQREIERVMSWSADLTAGRSRQVEWITRTIEDYARARFARTKTKTVKLPNGTLALVAQTRTKVETVDDDVVLLAASVDHPDLVRSKLSWDKKALAGCKPGAVIAADRDDGFVEHAAVDPDTGEVLAGVVLLVPEAGRMSFTIRKAKAN